MKERSRDSGKIIVLIALMLFLLSGCGGDSVDDKYEKTGKYLKEMTEETSPSVNSVGGEWVVIGLARSGTGLSEEAEEAYLQDADHLSGAGHLAADLSVLHRRDQPCAGFGLWRK